MLAGCGQSSASIHKSSATNSKMKLQFLLLAFLFIILHTNSPVYANPAELSTFTTSISPSPSTPASSNVDGLVGGSVIGGYKTGIHEAEEATPTPTPTSAPKKTPSKGLKTFEKVLIVILFIVILIALLGCYCAWEHRKGLTQVAMRAAI